MQKTKISTFIDKDVITKDIKLDDIITKFINNGFTKTREK